MYIHICVHKSIGKGHRKIHSKLIILITSWKVTLDIYILLELFTTIRCLLCENELWQIMLSQWWWSSLAHFLRRIRESSLCQQCCSKGLSCKLFGAVHPWPHDHGYSIQHPGVQPATLGLDQGLGPLISTPDWAPPTPPGTLVPPSDRGVIPGGLHPLNMLRFPGAAVSSLSEMGRLSPPFLDGLAFLCC